MKGLLAACVLSITIVLVGCGGDNGATSCALDRDCPIGSTCAAGACAAGACAVDGDCPLGALCVGDRCRPGCLGEIDCPVAAPVCDPDSGDHGACVECVGDRDCAAGWACDAGACVQSCRNDRDCDNGQCREDLRVCVDCEVSADCPSEQRCDRNECVAGCDADAACPADRRVCDLSNRTCVECVAPVDCGGRACVDHVCARGPARGVDLLFVVDDSANMAGHQANLGAAFSELTTRLTAELGALPDLHIGVISTNLGASGATGVPGCVGSGDNGNLLVGPAVANCATTYGLQGAYISDVAAAGGGRTRNYTAGMLPQLFTCMTGLGQTGCGFEQPLEAARRALEPGRNPGFLRPEAALAIVILTDEDDCSTSSPIMFGDPSAGPDSALGPRTSFRCFEFGVRCAETNPRIYGTKTQCVARTASPYMMEVTTLADEIKAAKPGGHVVVRVISGPLGANRSVVVGPAEDNAANPDVIPSCGATPTSGEPGVRLTAFVERVGAGASFGSICASVEANLAELAVQVAATQR